MAGLGIRNPVDTAAHVHTASKDACSYLTDTLLSGERFDYGYHCKMVNDAYTQARRLRLERKEDVLIDRCC